MRPGPLPHPLREALVWDCCGPEHGRGDFAHRPASCLVHGKDPPALHCLGLPATLPQAHPWPGGEWSESRAGAIWEDILQWMALEQDVHRCMDFYLSPGERTLRQKVQHDRGRASWDQARRTQEL